MQRKYTAKEISLILGTAQCTINKWVREGKIKSYRLPSGDNRILEEDLVDFMDTYTIPAKLLEEFKKGDRKINVLIIDDDSAIVSLLKRAFTRRKIFKVETAQSKFEAGTISERFKPNLIIVDHALEAKDAREVRKTLLKDPGLNQTKIVSISGSEYTQKEIRKKGYDAHYTKPFNPVQFVKEMEALLQKN